MEFYMQTEFLISTRWMLGPTDFQMFMHILQNKL